MFNSSYLLPKLLVFVLVTSASGVSKAGFYSQIAEWLAKNSSSVKAGDDFASTGSLWAQFKRVNPTGENELGKKSAFYGVYRAIADVKSTDWPRLLSNMQTNKIPPLALLGWRQIKTYSNLEAYVDKLDTITGGATDLDELSESYVRQMWSQISEGVETSDQRAELFQKFEKHFLGTDNNRAMRDVFADLKPSKNTDSINPLEDFDLNCKRI